VNLIYQFCFFINNYLNGMFDTLFFLYICLYEWFYTFYYSLFSICHMCARACVYMRLPGAQYISYVQYSYSFFVLSKLFFISSFIQFFCFIHICVCFFLFLFILLKKNIFFSWKILWTRKKEQMNKDFIKYMIFDRLMMLYRSASMVDLG